MEGYLKLKSTFSSSKVWVVLEGQDLSYYDHIDLVEQCPKKLLGTMHIKEAQITKKSEEKKKIFEIKIKNHKGSKLKFDCDDGIICSTWYNVLTRAVKEHVDLMNRLAEPLKFRAALEIDPSIKKLSRSIISAAYKKLSKRDHPDKGGDNDRFNRIREAYSGLMAIQAG